MSFIAPTGAFASATILNLRYWAAPDHTRVVLDSDEPVRFSVEKTGRIITMYLTHAVMGKDLSPEHVISKPGIDKIVLSSIPGETLKVEMFLNRNVDTKIFQLKKIESKPYRLVVDVVLYEIEKEKTLAREQVKILKKDKIIVIDPGHGGEDPGAIGPNGTHEKNVVLEISKKLRDTLNAGSGVRAYLTREGDYYVSFKKRLSIARELGADLFLSIHADAARNRTAKGSSVYCLSTGGASSEAARILAKKENMADIIGGTFGEGVSNDESDPIVLDMIQNKTINTSKVFGAKVLSEFGRLNDIKFSQVQEAPFRVLKLPEIPAVLIETAYISNEKEEQKLVNEAFQKDVAERVALSVREFFSLPEPVSPPVVAAGERRRGHSKTMKKDYRPVSYKVKRGDTLIRIATKHHTKVGTLAKLNRIKWDGPLYIGQVLRLSEKDEEEAKSGTSGPPVTTYRVKKGDTLSAIARRHGTDVAVLLKLNDMTGSDLLYVDRVLIIPDQVP